MKRAIEGDYKKKTQESGRVNRLKLLKRQTYLISIYFIIKLKICKSLFTLKVPSVRSALEMLMCFMSVFGLMEIFCRRGSWR